MMPLGLPIFGVAVWRYVVPVGSVGKYSSYDRLELIFDVLKRSCHEIYCVDWHHTQKQGFGGGFLFRSINLHNGRAIVKPTDIAHRLICYSPVRVTLSVCLFQAASIFKSSQGVNKARALCLFVRVCAGFGSDVRGTTPATPPNPAPEAALEQHCSNRHWADPLWKPHLEQPFFGSGQPGPGSKHMLPN